MMQYIRFALILNLIIGVSYAQEQADQEPILTHALQFKYNSGITLGSFNGSTLSYKEMVTPELEKRYSLTLNGNVYNQDQNADIETNYYALDTLHLRDEHEGDNRKQLNLSLGYCKLKHHHNIERVSLYYGWGPLVTYAYSSTDRDFDRTQDTLLVSTYTDNSASTFSAGVQGIVGWEWRVSNIISITAEYGSTLRMEMLKATNDTGQDDRSYRSIVTLTDIDRPKMELYGGTRIGVSLFF